MSHVIEPKTFEILCYITNCSLNVVGIYYPFKYAQVLYHLFNISSQKVQVIIIIAGKLPACEIPSTRHVICVFWPTYDEINSKHQH